MGCQFTLYAKWSGVAAVTADEPAETQETRVIWHWGVDASGEAAMPQ
jgi:hypothetical protein